MQTVYLIGNGFDVNLGLPTKYSRLLQVLSWTRQSSRYRKYI
ncbi:MAG: hypothetical protein HDS70_06460 [Bacteroidales bacterium]|nr:hypothetical protein [Bacteroidales bacterium]